MQIPPQTTRTPDQVEPTSIASKTGQQILSSKKQHQPEIFGSGRVSEELAKTRITVLVVVLETMATSSAKSRLVDSGVAAPGVAEASSLDAVAIMIAVTVLVCVVPTTAVKYTELGEPPPIVKGSMAGSIIAVAG